METLSALGASNGGSYKGFEMKLGKNSLGNWKEKGLQIVFSPMFHESNTGPDSAVPSFNVDAVKNTEVTELCRCVCSDTGCNDTCSGGALLLLMLLRWKLGLVCLHKVQSYLPTAI